MVQIRTSGSENHDNNAIELKVIVANEGEGIGNINLNNFKIHLFILKYVSFDTLSFSKKRLFLVKMDV